MLFITLVPGNDFNDQNSQEKYREKNYNVANGKRITYHMSGMYAVYNLILLPGNDFNDQNSQEKYREKTTT